MAIFPKCGVSMGETTKDDDSGIAFSLDRTDRKMLTVLARDGRISLTDLAAAVGLSKTPVQLRMRRMERAGIIAGYRAVLDPVRLGAAHVAFVEVRLSDTREPALQAFNKAVLGVSEIEECHMVAGGFDYLLKVRTTDITEYRRVMGERISSLPHVAATSTYVAMEAVKDDTAAIPAV